MKAKGKGCNSLILDIKELPDGNLSFIIDANKLYNNIGDDKVEINLLNEPLLLDKPKSGFNLKKTRLLLATLKRKIEQLKDDDKKIRQYVKKNGCLSLSIPLIRDYFEKLIAGLRDKKTPDKERGGYKAKLDKLIRALAHTDKKTLIDVDFEGDDVPYFYCATYCRAKDFYNHANDCCINCGNSRRFFSKCKKRRSCNELKEHLTAYYKTGEIADFLKYSNESKYAEDKTRIEFKLNNRGEVYKYLRYTSEPD